MNMEKDTDLHMRNQLSCELDFNLWDYEQNMALLYLDFSHTGAKKIVLFILIIKFMKICSTTMENY